MPPATRKLIGPGAGGFGGDPTTTDPASAADLERIRALEPHVESDPRAKFEYEALWRDVLQRRRGRAAEPPSDDVYRPDPGAMASIGVRKMDPEVMNQAAEYQPTLPVQAAPARTIVPPDVAARVARAGAPPMPRRLGDPASEPSGVTVEAGAPVIVSRTAAPGPRVTVRAPAPGGVPAPFESLAATQPGARGAPGDSDGAPAAVMRMAMGGAQPVQPTAVSEMEAAQEAASRRQLLANLARAGGVAGAAISGGRLDAAGYDALSEQAQGPVRELGQRRQAMDLARQDRMRDPTSPESAAVRARFRAAFPKLAEQYGADFERITAEDEPNLLRIGDVLARMGEREEDRAFRREGLRSAAADRALRREEMRGRQEEARTERGERVVERQQESLAEDLGKMGAPGFYQQYGEASRVLQDPKFSKDLPGVGRIEGRLPDEVTSDEGRTLRQAVGQMLAEYRKGVTGAGMSDAERGEYGRITGLLESGSEDAYRQGVERLKRAVDSRVQARAAGARPDVVERYQQRAPWMGAAMGAPSAGSATSGPERVQNREGRWFVRNPATGKYRPE